MNTALLAVITLTVYVQDTVAEEAVTLLIDNNSLVELAELDQAVAVEDLEGVRSALWEKYVAELKADETRIAEHAQHSLQQGEATMRYGVSRIGDKPDGGYPLYIALHGGGGAPAELNDSQWNHMKVYYRDSVENGIYVAPRGVSNTSNLHSRGESYPLYDRLIENMVALEGVDPNRVYVLGFSAGGDGVYQIGCRMPDRFAAANMSAGHPNGVNPRNLMNLPFLLQVGERDEAYNRHRTAAEFFLSLQNLHDDYDYGFESELFVHHSRPHNFFDNHPRQAPQAVLSDPQAWLDEGDRSSRDANTNAIAWLGTHRRNPWPNRVIWQLNTRASRSTASSPTESDAIDRSNLNYWLDVSDANLEGVECLDVELSTEANRIHVRQGADGLRLLINNEMLDLTQPIEVKISEETITVTARPSLRSLAHTLRERGDPNYMFEAAVVLMRNAGGNWSASAE